MENWIYYAAALAIALIGFSVGIAISDYFENRYWKMEIDRIKKIHESVVASATLASFNKGVLAALSSENDKDIPNE